MIVTIVKQSFDMMCAYQITFLLLETSLLWLRDVRTCKLSGQIQAQTHHNAVSIDMPFCTHFQYAGYFSIVWFHPCLVPVLFTGLSLRAIHFYQKFLL